MPSVSARIQSGVIAFLLLIAASGVSAQTSPPGDNPTDRDARIDALLKAWEALDLDGMVRLRPEWKYNLNFDRYDLSCSGTICKQRDDNQEFTGMRSEVGVTAKLSERSAARVRFQDSRVLGGERGSDSGLATANDDTRQSVDVREAWLELRKIGGTIDLRAGRLILAYGDQRLIGPLDWTQVGRSFDGLRLTYEHGAWSSDAFAVQLAEQDSDAGGNTTGVGATNNDLDDAHLFGLYNSWKVHDQFQMEPYYLGLAFSPVQRSQPVQDPATVQAGGGVSIITAQDRSRERDRLHTVGLRLTNRTAGGGKRAPGALDWSLEYAWQSGQSGRYVAAGWDYAQVTAPLPAALFTATANPCRVYNSSTNGCRIYTERQRYDAFAGAATFGYRLTEELRLGVDGVVASGDPNRNDGSISTFHNLFPTNHGVFGQADLTAWQNLKAWALKVDYDFGDLGKIRLAYWYADKFRKQDAWYKVTGGGQTGATNVSTESSSNARFATEYAADSSASALGVAHLRRHLFTEYDIAYERKAAGIEWSAGYSLIFGGDAVGALKDDLAIRQELYARRVAQDLTDGDIDRPAEFLALQRPGFRKQAHFGYLMATARF